MWVVLLVMWVISIALVELALRAAQPIKDYYSSQPITINPLRRCDLDKWSRPRFYIGSVLLLPRCVLIFICVVSHFLNSKLATLNYPVSDQPLIGVRRILFAASSRFWARLLLLALGFWKINTIGEPDDCSVIISNHCSCADILYFLTSPELPAFVSKATVKDYPFIGLIATAMQCIFVERTQNRGAALSSIKSRLESPLKGYPKLLVFPEGTTTNGTCLMEFKKGGFISLSLIQPVCLIYDQGYYAPNMDIVPMWVHGVLLCSQFSNKLTVHRLPVVRPQPGFTPEVYAEYVRDIMADYMKIPKTDFQIEEKFKLVKQIFKTKDKNS